MPDDAPQQLVGNADMGNVQVGHRGMAEALAAHDAEWKERHALSLAKAQEVKDARERGTNEVAEEVPYPKENEPVSVMQITERLIGEQLINLKRSPTDWEVNTVTFQNTQPTLLTGRRPLRETVLLFNGSANVTIAVTANNTATTKNFVLASGAAVAIDTEGPVWGTAVAGTTVVVMETFYDVRKMAAVVEEIARRLSPTVTQQVS